MIRCDICNKLTYESSLTFSVNKGFLCQICNNQQDNID